MREGTERGSVSSYLQEIAQKYQGMGMSPSEAWSTAVSTPTRTGWQPGAWEAATPKERWENVKSRPVYGMPLSGYEDPSTGLPRKSGNYWGDLIGAMVYGTEAPDFPKVPRVGAVPGQSTDITATADIVRDVERGSSSGANIVVGDVDIKNYEKLQEQLKNARTQEERSILQEQIKANDISRQQEAFIEDYRRRYGFDPDPSAVFAAIAARSGRGYPNVDWWG